MDPHYARDDRGLSELGDIHDFWPSPDVRCERWRWLLFLLRKRQKGKQQMFQKLLVAAIVKAICAALCQLYGFCICDDENCPDGVCDPAMKAIDDLGDASPEPVMTKAQGLLDFEPQWDQLQPLVDATVAFVAALQAFLGLHRAG